MVCAGSDMAEAEDLRFGVAAKLRLVLDSLLDRLVFGGEAGGVLESLERREEGSERDLFAKPRSCDRYEGARTSASST